MKSSWRSALHHIYALRGWPSTLPHTRFSVSAGWTEIRGWITHNLHTTKYREIQNRVLYVPVLYHYTSQNLHNYFKSLPRPYKVGTITFALQFWETEAESGLLFFFCHWARIWISPPDFSPPWWLVQPACVTVSYSCVPSFPHERP